MCLSHRNVHIFMGNPISQDAVKRLDEVRQFADFLGHPFRKTQIYLTRELILRLYTPAARDFGPHIAHLDALFAEEDDGAESRAASKAEDTLAAWLNNLHLEDDKPEEGHPYRQRTEFNKNTVTLYRCSWCLNPSAVLKKCSGCSKTRYVRGECRLDSN